MPPRNPMSEAELARLAATMRVSDPAVDNGAFTSVEHIDAMAWLFLLGVKEMDPDLKRTTTLSEEAQKELALEKLRLALWDIQRFGSLYGALCRPDGVLGWTCCSRGMSTPTRRTSA